MCGDSQINNDPGPSLSAGTSITRKSASVSAQSPARHPFKRSMIVGMSRLPLLKNERSAQEQIFFKDRFKSVTLNFIFFFPEDGDANRFRAGPASIEC